MKYRGQEERFSLLIGFGRRRKLRALTNQLLENHSEQIVLYVTAISVSHQLGLLFKIPNVPRETFPQ